MQRIDGRNGRGLGSMDILILAVGALVAVYALASWLG